MILLHYHTTFTRYADDDPAHADSVAVIEGLEMLLREGMIATSSMEEYYRTTRRGEVFIEHLMHIPFPEQQWVIPIPTAATEKRV